MRGKKKDLTEVNDELGQLTYELNTELQHCKALQSQVVRSPDRLRGETRSKKDALLRENGSPFDPLLVSRTLLERYEDINSRVRNLTSKAESLNRCKEVHFMVIAFA